MYSKMAMFTIVVNDYDEAIRFYTKKMGFVLLEDTDLGGEKRWVRISPNPYAETAILLAKAKNEREKQSIGNQTGGRVGFFVHTQDILKVYQHLTDHHVKLVRPLTKEEFGMVAVFQDDYGNLWDIIQPAEKRQ
jgi:catechol 2,3-dioxygenase-like lactoylglutathione lyase family enzyme